MSDADKTKSKLIEELGAVRARLQKLESTLDEKEQVFESLKENYQRFRKIFDHSNDGIFVVDPLEDEILDVNSKACEMLGYTREELLSVPMSVVHPHEMDRMRSFARSVYKEGQGWTDELSCLTKPGVMLAAEISASMIELHGQKRMLSMVRDISDRDRLAREKELLIDELRSELGFGSIIGESQALKTLIEQIELVAPTDATVLISGESGTGKELVAREIHERSTRSKRSLVRVNCASIPAELFESEFFGHVKGAFTSAMRDRKGRFDLADGGTLLLDEVGEIPLALQGKLLRVLQEGQFERVGESHTRRVDVRVIAASNRDLLSEVEAGQFRQDLFYRLSVFPIEVEPLRKRREDIAPLAEHFITQICTRLQVPRKQLPSNQLELLYGYDWPGNVRELQNVIERAIIVSRDGLLRFELGDGTRANGPAQQPADGAYLPDAEKLSLDTLKRLEREVIERAMEETAWKISGDDGAAARLGLRPSTLASRLKKLGLKKPGSS